jgi:gamma-glutamylcyclotransferase (GGCT)/AIG2-like uncharacterized protein YtfP
MLYYAYGSNLSTKYVRVYCPSAKFVMRADLPNYHIEFRRYSTNLKGGISTIIEAPGEMVHGVIYEVSPEEIFNLDVLEKVPEGIYKREGFQVFGEDGKWYKADLFRVSKPEGPFTPSKKYVSYMLEGMKEHKIEQIYVKNFEKIYRELPEEI